MSGKPSEVALLQPKPTPSTPTTSSSVSKGPSYNDAFAQFLQQATTKAPAPKNTQKSSQNTKQPESEVQTPTKSNRGRKKKQPEVVQNQEVQQWTTETNQMLQQPLSNQQEVIAQNPRVKTERIPQSTQQMYAIQENTVLTTDGKQQKLYYTILNPPTTTSNNCNTQQPNKMSGQYTMYGQQQQQSF